MERITTEYDSTIILKPLRSGRWEACLNGKRVCLTERRSTALAIARARDRHEAERRAHLDRVSKS